MPTKPPERQPAERRTLSMPPDWWLAFEQAAIDAGKPLSMWVGELVSQHGLTATQRKALSPRPRSGRPRRDRQD